MKGNKTKPTAQSVSDFLDGIADEARRKDCRAVLRLMRQITGEAPRMWGTSMVGFGTYHYKYASGHEGDYFVTGFSPRKTDLTLYLMCGFDQHGSLMKKLGKFKTGKSCLYIRNLADVDIGVLKELIARSVAQLRRVYP